MKPANGKTTGALAQWHTFQEAMAQPAVWRSWAGALANQAAEISTWIRSGEYDEIWFCGAGTSAFIGETLSTYLNGRPGRARYRSVPTTDLVSCPRNYIRPGVKVLVVSFGRSGNSSETIGALDLLDRHAPDADRLNFTCNAGGVLATRKAPGPGEQRLVLLPPETNDQALAMTSSYSTMLLSALACLDGHPPMPVADAIAQLSSGAEAVLSQSLALARAAGGKTPSRAVFLGSGVLQGAAHESALKVLELSAGAIPTLWDSTLGFRHGPKAVVDANTRVHVLVSGDPHTRRYDMDAANEIKAQFGSGSVLILGPDQGQVNLHVPMVGNDAWTAVLYVVAAQIQAIVWSESLGLNIDNPFSGGTVRRVVEGVTLYPLD
ncbi:MAG: SIS domain-containing protein [Paracoccaceae bacterium]|nr:SIS domain-containing protein [Paracoccaceae bacterium]